MKAGLEILRHALVQPHRDLLAEFVADELVKPLVRQHPPQVLALIRDEFVELIARFVGLEMTIAGQPRMGQRDRAAGILAEIIDIVEHDHARAGFAGPVLEVLLVLAEDGGHESVDFQRQLPAVLAEHLVTAVGVAHAREVGEVGRARVLRKKHICRQSPPELPEES